MNLSGNFSTDGFREGICGASYASRDAIADQTHGGDGDGTVPLLLMPFQSCCSTIAFLRTFIDLALVKDNPFTFTDGLIVLGSDIGSVSTSVCGEQTTAG